jgi:pyruvoyl-dependent arginine decarboxylase (PvlArgDC)
MSNITVEVWITTPYGKFVAENQSEAGMVVELVEFIQKIFNEENAEIIEQAVINSRYDLITSLLYMMKRAPNKEKLHNIANWIIAYAPAPKRVRGDLILEKVNHPPT